MIELHKGDCLRVMDKLIERGIKVDAVITDPPYGTTACKWDSIIPLDKMWNTLLLLVKKRSAIIFTASQPFTSKLIMNNPKYFRHSWVYQKAGASNFAQAKYAPMKEHEDVLVFGVKSPNYYPIKEQRKGSGSDRVKYIFSDATRHKSGDFVNDMQGGYRNIADTLRYPSSVQFFNNRAKGDRGLHPTQKPLALLEYLVKTYTKENQIVLDFTMGSGTTGVACKKLGRHFIGIEKDPEYFNIAVKRIKETK